jgi:hypothetical protein
MNSTSRSIAARVSTRCPASPAMSARMLPARPCPRAPTARTSMMLLVDVGTNAEIVLGNRNRVVAAPRPPAPPSKAPKSLPASVQRQAPSSACASTRDAGAALPRHRLDKWSDEPGFDEASPRPPASPASAARRSSRWSRRCTCRHHLRGRRHRWLDGGEKPAHPPERAHLLLSAARRRAAHHRDPERRPRHPACQGGALCRRQASDGKAWRRDMSTRSASPAPSAAFIDPKYAMVLGLIPDCDLDEVKAVGNAAGTGALMALLNRDHRREIETEVGQIEKIETALEPTSSSYSSTPWRCPTRSIHSPSCRPRSSYRRARRQASKASFPTVHHAAGLARNAPRVAPATEPQGHLPNRRFDEVFRASPERCCAMMHVSGVFQPGNHST